MSTLAPQTPDNAGKIPGNADKIPGNAVKIHDVPGLWYTRCPVPTPLGLAVQLGYFRDEFAPDGLELKSLQESLDPAIKESHFDHTLSNSFRQGGNIPAIWARANGRRTRVIGLNWTDESLLVIALPGSGIVAPKDLAGRRLALPVNSGSIDFNRATALRAYDKVLELEGLALKDVELVDTVAPPQPEAGSDIDAAGRRLRRRSGYFAETRALLNGEVDAIFVKGVHGVEIARALAAHIVTDIGFHPDPKVRINNGAPRTLTVDQDLLDARPDLVARFLKRIVEAGEWARSHPAETHGFIADETSSFPDLVRAAYGDKVHQNLGTFLNEESIAALGDFKDFLFRHGFLKSDFDIRDWVSYRAFDHIEPAIAAQ